jgi:hypothetical protein
MKESFGATRRTWLLVVLGFSAAAFLVRWAGFTIPVVGMFNFDLREVFVTLGAAITGPVGGAVIGFFAGLPTGFLSDMAAHSASGLFVGLLYRPVYNRWRMPALLLVWGLLLVTYYYGFLIPVFLAAALLTESPSIPDIFGSDLSFFQAYAITMQAVWPEVLGTLIVTALILVGLPEKYRRPLW